MIDLRNKRKVNLISLPALLRERFAVQRLSHWLLPLAKQLTKLSLARLVVKVKGFPRALTGYFASTRRVKVHIYVT